MLFLSFLSLACAVQFKWDPLIPGYSNIPCLGLQGVLSLSVRTTEGIDDWIAVGASDGNLKKGQVNLYKFDATSGNWTFYQWLTIEPVDLFKTYFGTSVAILGDNLLVGALLGTDGKGAVYFYGLSKGKWLLKQKLVCPDQGGCDKRAWFGARVTMWKKPGGGVMAAVAAPWADNGDVVSAGTIYIYRKTGQHFKHVQTIAAADAAACSSKAGLRMGQGIAVCDDILFVGSCFAGSTSAGELLEQGAIYVFTPGADGVYAQKSRVFANDSVAGDQFGYSVSCSPKSAGLPATVMASSQTADIADSIKRKGTKPPAPVRAGTVYAFYSDDPATIPFYQMEKLFDLNGKSGDKFGTSISQYSNYFLLSASYANVDFQPYAGKIFAGLMEPDHISIEEVADTPIVPDSLLGFRSTITRSSAYLSTQGVPTACVRVFDVVV